MKYSLDTILEMLGGYQAFGYETVYYVYYKVNGMEEEAKECYEKIQEENKRLQEIADKMKRGDELIEKEQEISNHNA